MQYCGNAGLMQHAAVFLYYFLQFPHSSFKEWTRVDFRPIELRRPLRVLCTLLRVQSVGRDVVPGCAGMLRWPESENQSSAGSRTVETTILFFDIDSGPCRNRLADCPKCCRREMSSLCRLLCCTECDSSGTTRMSQNIEEANLMEMRMRYLAAARLGLPTPH
ncbi:hypothetical protein EVAR_63626_1 [Eumeta japonica]|uniref:Uncharacterized protein n=1 Tax=Eumeta variegata TaxID=151549 RepID=A0A4C1ZT53_EUMVA|nr:hypothetical protein EVAR_63626_1 [Eumeta japonica]